MTGWFTQVPWLQEEPLLNKGLRPAALLTTSFLATPVFWGLQGRLPYRGGPHTSWFRVAVGGVLSYIEK